MKKLFVLMVLVLLLPAASAKLLSENILVNRIRLGDYGYVTGPDMDSYIYIYNNNPTKDLEDVRVSIRILDADIYDSTTSFNLKDGNGIGKSLITPINGLESGEYLVRITVSSGDVRRVKHRYITII